MTQRKVLEAIKFFEAKNLEKRFHFLENKVLKQNLAIKLQYVHFLLRLEEGYELPGALRYSTFKTIIIFTASIIEALINNKLHQLIKEGRIEEVQMMGKEEKFSIVKDFQRISDSEEICGIKRTRKSKKLTEKNDFQELNRAAKRSGLFNETLFKQAEKIRQIRNKIHPYPLKEVDDKYTKAEINSLFAITGNIIKRIENY